MATDKDQGKNPGRDAQIQKGKKDRESLNPYKEKTEVSQGREKPEDLAEEEQQFKEAMTERD